MTTHKWRSVLPAVLSLILLASPFNAFAQDTFSLSGFAKLQGTSVDDALRARDDLSAQIQMGVDWTPSALFRAHVHVLGRSDDAESRDGTLGITEAYLEWRQNFGETLIRARGGAMFLPTSRENVEALWENPYTISSSALNSWFGEEFRPIGIDLAVYRGGFVMGGTLFRGNDTFGALPPVRGWDLHDHWTLLGEKVPVDGAYFTSVSEETDGRLGYSWRAAWQNDTMALQLTHIDNRSDALEYGDLYNWNTRFNVVGLDYVKGDWTVAAESGWGPTVIIVGTRAFVSDIRASYLLVSRELVRARATVRVDEFDDGTQSDQAFTIAFFWLPPGDLSIGSELVTKGDDSRFILQFRYGFSM